MKLPGSWWQGRAVFLVVLVCVLLAMPQQVAAGTRKFVDIEFDGALPSEFRTGSMERGSRMCGRPAYAVNSLYALPNSKTGEQVQWVELNDLDFRGVAKQDVTVDYELLLGSGYRRDPEDTPREQINGCRAMATDHKVTFQYRVGEDGAWVAVQSHGRTVIKREGIEQYVHQLGAQLAGEQYVSLRWTASTTTSQATGQWGLDHILIIGDDQNYWLFGISNAVLGGIVAAFIMVTGGGALILQYRRKQAAAARRAERRANRKTIEEGNGVGGTDSKSYRTLQQPGRGKTSMFSWLFSDQARSDDTAVRQLKTAPKVPPPEMSGAVSGASMRVAQLAKGRDVKRASKRGPSAGSKRASASSASHKRASVKHVSTGSHRSGGEEVERKGKGRRKSRSSAGSAGSWASGGGAGHKGRRRHPSRVERREARASSAGVSGHEMPSEAPSAVTLSQPGDAATEHRAAAAMVTGVELASDENGFVQLLYKYDLRLVSVLEQVAPLAEHAELAEHVVMTALILAKQRKAARKMAEWAVSRNVVEAADVSDVLKPQQFTAMIVATFARALSIEYLKQALETTMKSLSVSKVLEVDVARGAIASTEQEGNQRELQRVVEALVEGLLRAVVQMPADLQITVRHASKVFRARFGDDEELLHAVLAKVLFSDLICAAIAAPKSFGLQSSPPSVSASRNLLLASSLLAVASGARDVIEAAWMQPMHAWMQRMQPRCHKFLDAVVAAGKTGSKGSAHPQLPKDATRPVIRIAKLLGKNKQDFCKAWDRSNPGTMSGKDVLREYQHTIDRYEVSETGHTSIAVQEETYW